MNKTILLSACLLFVISFNSCSQVSSTSTKNESIDSLVSAYAAYKNFNGSVLVVQQGKVLYKKGVGMANRELDVPNTPHTKFRIGSVTKQFTAMLIVQLAAENKVDLHTPISKYLPEYPKENGSKITLHHLLTHSSGVPNSSEPPSPKKNNPNITIPDNYAPEELVRKFSSLPLKFNPGEQFSYSNSGYVLLGLILEKVTGKTYQELLQEKIFTPLNMKNTGFDKHRSLIKHRASGYFKNWEGFFNANYTDLSIAYSAGALYSTVEDLQLWDEALYTEKLLPKNYLDLITTQHIPDPDYGGYYGYGWSIKDKFIGSSKDKTLTISHDGVIDGFCAILTRIPSTKSTIILMSNISRAPLNAMTKGILGILHDKPYDFPTQSVAFSMLETIDNEGIEKGIAHYETIKNKAGYSLYEDEMNIVSYKLLQSDRAKEAASVLELGITAFPKAFNLYDSYGEVLLALGDTSKAIKNYQHSVKLNPQNKNGLSVLEKLAVKTKKVNLNVFEKTPTWGQEIFTFPIHFAPEIPYEGFEDIRFSPGWSSVDSAGFWTYAFAWSITANALSSQQELAKNLGFYFDGLMEGVNKDKDKLLPKTIVRFKNNKKDRANFKGNLTIYDAFTTKKPLTLNVKVTQHLVGNKAIIVFKFSPKEFNHSSWKELEKITLRDGLLAN